MSGRMIRGSSFQTSWLLTPQVRSPVYQRLIIYPLMCGSVPPPRFEGCHRGFITDKVDREIALCCNYCNGKINIIMVPSSNLLSIMLVNYWFFDVVIFLACDFKYCPANSDCTEQESHREPLDCACWITGSFPSFMFATNHVGELQCEVKNCLLISLNGLQCWNPS